ncbi:MAG: DUF2877 domain-containing protein [Clostridiaceae bacterium]|nr:DUF2877 domain-containing protein [Clostridiaceae bacterium]
MCDKIIAQINKDGLVVGMVHSVFDGAFNVLTSNGIMITFLNHKKAMFPLSIKLNTVVSFHSIGIDRDMTVEFTKKEIFIKQLNLNMNIGKLKPWSPTPCFDYEKTTKENVSKKLEEMEDFIYAHGSLEGVGSLIFHLNEEVSGISNRHVELNRNHDFILERFLRFVKLSKCYDTKNIAEATVKIIGFGPGLTPATDDFISGLMIAFIYLGNYLNQNLEYIYKFNIEIIKNIDGKTTTVSEKMLRLSANGEASDTIRNLMVSLLSRDRQERFQANLKELVDFGGTSGTDILSGIYIGSRIMLNNSLRRLR